MRLIYMDYAATTPTDQRVLDAMLPYFSTLYGNPSSLHSFGRDADDAVEKARKSIAAVIKASPQETIFLSSGSEANNTVIANLGKGDHMVTTR